MPPIVPAASGADRVSPTPGCGGRGGVLGEHLVQPASATIRPSRTTGRPATIVSRAPTGPQRSQASIGSADGAGEGGPGRATTRRRHRPRPARARRARRCGRGTPLRRAWRSRAPSARCRWALRCGAWRAASPGAPRATATPSRPTTSRRRRARPPRRPPAGRPRERCPTPGSGCSTGSGRPTRRPRRADGSRRRSGITQWATHVRSLAHPVRSRYSVGRQPKWATLYSSSSTFSAKCVCSRTSSRSASSAVRTISCSVTLNGEHGASAIRVIAPHARSWWRCTASSLAARIESSSSTTWSGGSPPSFCDSDIEPRVGWNRIADLAGGLDLGGQQVAGAMRVQVEVVGRGRASGQRQLRQADPGRHVHRLGVERRPQRIQRRQPSEQRLVGHRRVGPGQVLEHVMVGVDQARRDQAVGGVDHRRRVGRSPRRRPPRPGRR